MLVLCPSSSPDHTIIIITIITIIIISLLAYLDFHQPQIVAIQETKIDSSISTSELFPETCPYNVYRKDRNSKGGGVILVSTSWSPGRNLAELTSEIDLLRSQLQKIKCMHKGNNPPQSMFWGTSTSEILFGQIDLTNQVHR